MWAGHPKRGRTIAMGVVPANRNQTKTASDMVPGEESGDEACLGRPSANPNFPHPAASSQGLNSLFSFFLTATPLIVT